MKMRVHSLSQYGIMNDLEFIKLFILGRDWDIDWKVAL